MVVSASFSHQFKNTCVIAVFSSLQRLPWSSSWNNREIFGNKIFEIQLYILGFKNVFSYSIQNLKLLFNLVPLAFQNVAINLKRFSVLLTCIRILISDGKVVHLRSKLRIYHNTRYCWRRLTKLYDIYQCCFLCL